jgi:integrase
VTFVQSDGRPPEHPADVLELTLAGLRDAYLRSQESKLEDTTLAGIRLHFGHLVRLLGPDRTIPALNRADLQGYIDTRAGEWIDPNAYRVRRRERDAAKKPRKNRKPPPPASEDRPRRHPSAATIRKEIVSLRTAWNWVRCHFGLKEEFPGRDLDYAKTVEHLPFMTWEEAERRVKAGDDPDRVWECVYLRPAEIAELLAWVRERLVSPWVYPMVCFAAHTGARRSEIVRALPSDLDLGGGTVTIREKKRDKRKLTTRRVPLSPFLKGVLEEWVANRAGGKTLFCKGDGAEIAPREAHNYLRRVLRVSKWKVLRGWHVFRHSLISALASKGVDQRVIDDMVGHSTEEQRRRYRHLYPDVKQQAISSVFG